MSLGREKVPKGGNYQRGMNRAFGVDLIRCRGKLIARGNGQRTEGMKEIGGTSEVTISIDNKFIVLAAN